MMTDEKKPEKKPYVPARTVYIGLRRYDPKLGKAVPCNGLAIRAFDFTPEEVHAAIIDGLKRLAANYQRQKAQKGEATDGAPASDAGSLATVGPGGR